MVTLNKNVELEFAKVASHDTAMDQAARKVESAIKAQAPVDKGAFINSIKTTTVRTPRGVKDRVIYTDDPQAHIIEWGHISRSGRWVPGAFTFSRGLMTIKFGG